MTFTEATHSKTEKQGKINSSHLSGSQLSANKSSTSESSPSQATISQAATSQAAISQATINQIAIEAYSIYQKAGYPQGCAEQHWLQAEAKLKHHGADNNSLHHHNHS